ncbi:glucosyl transferase, partial [Streptococcus salivarius]
MKVHSNFTGPKSKKRLIAFSCATALASFAFIARPAFAEEAKVDNSSNLDTTAATSTNVETTADLVETKVVEAPATTEKVASTESTTNVSEQVTTSAASSEVVSETASTTASESQTPAESATGQTREAVTTDRAANEPASVPNETNVTGGQYYRDEYGYWHYKDASGKDLTGPQTIDGVKVYFRDSGVQVKGEFTWDGHYYDKDSGALVTNKFVESYGSTYYLDENGNKVIGPKEINGEWNYFDD